MKSSCTYLTFDGTCRDAMTFYAKCLNAEIHLMKFSDAPADGKPAGDGDRIMHSRITKGGPSILMASDSMEGHPVNAGSNFSIAVECESAAEIDTMYAAFSEGGTATMPLTDTFWGARFGMLIDKFGIQWMFNFEKPKA